MKMLPKKAENIGEIPEENSTKNKAESIVLIKQY